MRTRQGNRWSTWGRRTGGPIRRRGIGRHAPIGIGGSWFGALTRSVICPPSRLFVGTGLCVRCWGRSGSSVRKSISSSSRREETCCGGLLAAELVFVVSPRKASIRCPISRCNVDDLGVPVGRSRAGDPGSRGSLHGVELCGAENGGRRAWLPRHSRVQNVQNRPESRIIPGFVRQPS